MSLLRDKIELGIAETELETQKALSSYPPFLRWTVILCVIAVIPAYFTAKTIGDKIWQNRLKTLEMGAKPSFQNPKPPKVTPVTLIHVGTGDYMAVAGIENENLDLSAKQLAYEFKFYNEKKELAANYANNIFLLSNQKKFLITPKINGTVSLSYATLEISKDPRWQKKLNLPEIKLQTSGGRFYQQSEPPAFVVEGYVINNSPYNLNKVTLSFVIYDKKGVIAAASSRDEFSLVAGERRAFRQLWPNTVIVDPAKLEILADTDILDKNNVTIKQSDIPNSDPASDLSRPKTNNYGF